MALSHFQLEHFTRPHFDPLWIVLQPLTQAKGGGSGAFAHSDLRGRKLYSRAERKRDAERKLEDDVMTLFLELSWRRANGLPLEDEPTIVDAAKASTLGGLTTEGMKAVLARQSERETAQLMAMAAERVERRNEARRMRKLKILLLAA